MRARGGPQHNAKVSNIKRNRLNRGLYIPPWGGVDARPASCFFRISCLVISFYRLNLTDRTLGLSIKLITFLDTIRLEPSHNPL